MLILDKIKTSSFVLSGKKFTQGIYDEHVFSNCVSSQKFNLKGLLHSRPVATHTIVATHTAIQVSSEVPPNQLLSLWLCQPVFIVTLEAIVRQN